MITQLFYQRCGDRTRVWATTASDNLYNTFSRVHMYSSLKPTKRMVRALQRKSNKQAAAYKLNHRRMCVGSPSMLVQLHECKDSY